MQHNPQRFEIHSKKNQSTDLTAEVLTKASKTLLVEAQQGEDLEKPFHLCQVNRCYSFIQLLGNDDPQLLLCFLKHQQTGVHVAACGATILETTSQAIYRDLTCSGDYSGGTSYFPLPACSVQ